MGLMTILRELASVPPETRRNVMRRVGQMLFFDALIALLLFVSAGSLDWRYAWLYTAAMVLIQLGGAFFMPLEVLAERGSKKENTEKWDRVVTGLILPSFLSLYLVAGLDFRWHWSPESGMAWHLGAVLFFILGCALEMWAMAANRFFSTAVRIQFDRGHAACTDGPYRYVRHPGYVGMILYYRATPIFLGSLWALMPAAMVAILLVIRTWLEDRTLQKKLPGYTEYAARVRFRLVPGVW
jgi:protein-S-isoprenylcysteine O-methyltransferase Ste14